MNMKHAENKITRAKQSGRLPWLISEAQMVDISIYVYKQGLVSGFASAQAEE
jgi:hypothetical protein